MTILRTWSSKRGEEVGVSVTHQAVEFWRVTPGNVQHSVCLADFLYHHAGVDHTAYLVGEEKTVEVYDYVSQLMEDNSDYVDPGAPLSNTPICPSTPRRSEEPAPRYR